MISAYDIKTAVTKIIKDYEYTLVVVVSMALSLSVSMFLYAQIHGMAIQKLPFPAADRWAQVTRLENGRSFMNGGLSHYETGYLMKNQTSLDNIGFWEPRNSTFSTDAFTFSAIGVATHSNLFLLAGVEPVLGRTLLPEDDQSSTQDVVVISYDLWERYFGKDPKVLDGIVHVEGQPKRIVGVMPKGFAAPSWHSFWEARHNWFPETAGGGGWVTLYGLLKEGVTWAQAQEEFEHLSQQIQKDYPKEFQGRTAQLEPYTEAYSRQMRVVTTIMSFVAAAILAIGCFSVGNLLLVRSLENARETAIKNALGLPLHRIIAVGLLESFILCVLSGLLGLALCYTAVQYLGGSLNYGPFWWKVQSGSHLYVMCGIFVMITWLVTGVLPTWAAFRRPTTQGLSAGTKGGVNAKAGPLTQVFVSLQILCAFVLLVFTGMSSLALSKILNADYGVNTESYAVTRVKPPQVNYPQLEDRVAFFQRMQTQVEQVPGVQGVAFTGGMPGGYGYGASFQSLEREILDKGATPKANHINISDNYFELMGVELLQGRAFTTADNAQAESVAIINERMAQLLWPNQTQYVGRQFQQNPETNGELLTVIGVASEVIYGSPISHQSEDLNAIYRPMYQASPGWWAMNMVLKTDGNPTPYYEEIQKVGREVDAGVAMVDLTTLETYLERNSSRVKDMLLNFLPAAVLALLMCGLSIYGITKRIVLQKTPEVGLMKAIGIPDGKISGSFLGRACKQFIFGVIPGVLLLAYVIPTIFENQVVFDMVENIIIGLGVFGLIGCIVFVASYLPLVKLHKLSPKAALTAHGAE